MATRVSRRVSAALAAGGAAAVLLGVVVFLTSCAGLQGIFGGMVEKPRVSLISVNVERLSFDGADLLFDLKVANPNEVGVKLVEFDYSLYFEDLKFTEGSRVKNLNIGPNTDASVEFPLPILYEDFFKALAGIAEGATADYRLELGFLFDVPSLGKTLVPVTAKGDIPVMRKPSLRLAAVRVSRLDFTEADLVLSVDVRNPNDFSFAMDRFDFVLEVGGQDWASGGIKKETGIAAGAEVLIPVPIKVLTFFIGQTGYRQLLETRPLSYRLRGAAGFSAPDVSTGGIEFPFDDSGIVEVTR